MEAMFFLSLFGAAFLLAIIIPYMLLSTWRWRDYRKRGGHKSWWKYLNEDC